MSDPGGSDSRARVERLGSIVRQRRMELGYSQKELSAHGGPSARSVTNLEQGEGPTPTGTTLAKLDAALEWPPRTAAAILAGADAPTADEPSEAMYTAEDFELYNRLTRALYRAGITEVHTRSVPLPPADGTSQRDYLRTMVEFLESFPAKNLDLS